ncbi:MAG: alkaline phosphatase family protein [Spirochaetales bacterium]|nr:alkaline phosphatase family protein [Spirochaetales bacterium]
MRIIYLFIDGIGFGKDDPDTNPFSRYATSYLSALGGRAPEESLVPGFVTHETDASLGLPGLPQSATGQTSLWTGLNGARVMGRHMTGFPGPTLRRVIYDWSIVLQYARRGRRASLLNAYSEAYIQRISHRPRLMSASTHIQVAAGQALKRLEDLEAGDAVYMDITHEIMHRLFPHLRARFPIRSPREVGADLVRIAKRYDLVLHEFFITDKAGHDMSWETAEWAIRTLEAFIDGIVAAMDPENELLLVTSDHGNLEDLSRKTHTENRVPTLAFGAGADQLPASVQNLADIPAFIYKMADLPVALPDEADYLSEEARSSESG